MAEILIQWRNHTHDPSAPKQGDVRYVGVDGTDWGTHCDKRLWVADGRNPNDFPDDYAIIAIAGVTDEQLAPIYEQIDDDSDPDNPILLHRYGWKINISELPVQAQADLEADRFAAIAPLDIWAATEHKTESVYFDPTKPNGRGNLRLPG